MQELMTHTDGRTACFNTAVVYVLSDHNNRIVALSIYIILCGGFELHRIFKCVCNYCAQQTCMARLYKNNVCKYV